MVRKRMGYIVGNHSRSAVACTVYNHTNQPQSTSLTLTICHGDVIKNCIWIFRDCPFFDHLFLVILCHFPTALVVFLCWKRWWTFVVSIIFCLQRAHPRILPSAWEGKVYERNTDTKWYRNRVNIICEYIPNISKYIRIAWLFNWCCIF